MAIQTPDRRLITWPVGTGSPSVADVTVCPDGHETLHRAAGPCTRRRLGLD